MSPRFVVPLIAATFCAYAQTNVLTYHNDNLRTGQNLSETSLTPANVRSTSFGKIFNFPVDGKVDAQPLVVSGLTIPAKGPRNVVFVATEHDSLYAFDADSGESFWRAVLLNAGETPSDPRGCGQVSPEIGITATPVIDPAAGPHGTIYVVAMSKDAGGSYHQRLHAIDITTGAEQFGGPVEIQATYPGTGDNSNSSGFVVFDARQYKERTGLLLVNGVIYTSWASHCDIRPYTGWTIGYNQNTLAQTNVFNFAPNGNEASIWGAGGGASADQSGNLFFQTANGTFDTMLTPTGFPNKGDYGNSFVKVAPAGGMLTAVDYWTMYNTVAESNVDEDLGSGGVLLLPDVTDSTAKVRHLGVGAGKDRNIYVFDRDNMGKFNPSNNTNLYQELPAALSGGEYASPAWFNGNVYFGSVGDVIRAFPVTAARLGSAPSSSSPTSFTYPGTTPSVSANGPANGILWAVENSSPAVLHAYDANNLVTELYNSNQAPSGRDQFGPGNKFITPTVANGKVFVGTQNSVAVFGLLPVSAQATFVKTDSATQGNWWSGYGADGYNVIGDLAANPAYAAPAPSGQSFYTWANSTSDIRALQKVSNSADRVAATWYSGSSFIIDTNITDTTPHLVALYCLDWDSTGRRQTIDVLDDKGNVLNTQILNASFHGGVYLVWNVTGHVKFRFTWNAGFNAVVSGLFFGGPAGSPPATASFVKADSTTQGNWRSAYGADGYNIIGDLASNPSYAAPAGFGNLFYIWAASTPDIRALQKASNASDRIAATWYSGSSFLIDTNITDQAPHQVALYCLDWDTSARQQTVDVLDGNGNVLDTQALNTSFHGGVYLVWNVTGHVKFRVTWKAGFNAVVSGLFFGGPAGSPPPTGTAAFVKADSATQGNWQGVYGADGYNVIGDLASNPAYAAPTASGQLSYTWAASTADVRALQKASNPADRIAATWYSGSSFIIDTNITDQAPHQVALYCVDWDTTARRQTIDVLDSNGTLLNTQTLNASFNGGVYLVWNVTGHVKFRVTWNAGFNAVVSGIFFR